MTAAPEILRTLSRGLSGAFHVVAQPDHPMLLVGPDILVGGEGKLTAIFLIERKTSKKELLGRIMATRLAMPSNTRIFAWMSQDANVSPSVLRNFDETDQGDGYSTRLLLRYCTSNTAPRIDMNALADSKRRHAEKYSFAYLLSSLRRKHELDSVPSDQLIDAFSRLEENISTNPEWLPTIGANILTSAQSLLNLPTNIVPGAARQPRKRRSSVQVMGSYVTSLTSRRNSVRELRTLCNSNLIQSYGLDNGVPYLNPDASLGILLVEHWPTVRHDPEKPSRAAAFSGSIMAKSTSAEDIFSLIGRSRDPKYTRRWKNA